MTDQTATSAGPRPIGDFLEGGLPFRTEHLSEKLRLKCRYVYLTTRVQKMQDRGESISPELRETHDRLHERLTEIGVRPSQLIPPTG